MRKLIILLLTLILTGIMSVPSYATGTNLRIGVEYSLPPFQFINDTRTINGLHIDIMDEIAALQDWNIEYVPMETTTKAIEALSYGEIDAIIGIPVGDKLPDHLTKTNELSTASISLVVENNHLEQVHHPRETTERYTTAYEFGTLSLSQISQLNTLYTSIMGNQAQLFSSLVSGEVDSIVTVKESFLYQLKQNSQIPNNTFTIVNNYMGTVDYTVVVPKSDRLLLSSINNALTQLRYSGQYDQLVDAWLPNTELLAAEVRIDKLVQSILIVVGISMLVLLVFSYWNRKLKMIVEEKTQEIKQQMINLEQESLLRNLLIEHAPNSIMLVNASGDILHMNPRSKEVANLSHNAPAVSLSQMDQLEVFGDIWNETNHLSDRQIMDSSTLTSIADRSGKERLFRYQYYSLNNEDDKVLFVEDVTEEEQERTEAFETNKNQTLNRMIAGVAHEIKNPLTSIKAFASLIKDQATEKEFQDSFSKYVPEEVDRINRLIESLINYARPVRGICERIDLGQLVEECTQLTMPSADPRIQFTNQTEADCWILANRDQIKQVIINLLINAIESVNERLSRDGMNELSIETVTTKRDNKIGLTIYDEGVGMNKEVVLQCVEPFYSTKARGTGMGLSLAKQFVQENKGDFFINSIEDQYTRITLMFPEDKK